MNSHFGYQSRRHKKAAYIRIKNRIRLDAPQLGGKFTSHHLIHGKNNWLDAEFLGRRQHRFYHLALVTTRCAYIDVVRERAVERSYALAPEREPLFPDQAETDPKTGRVFIPYRERLRYPELDGMTRYEWEEAQYPAIANAGDLEVHEHWTLLRRHGVGIDLYATINLPFLTVEVVNQFIDRFLVNEADFFDPTPLRYRYEDIPNWGLDANEVIGIGEESLS